MKILAMITLSRSVFLLLLPLFCSAFYLPAVLRKTFADMTNQLESSENGNQTVEEVASESGEFGWDCESEVPDDDQPKQLSNCELLIGTLRDPALEINDREFCCTLLSSQSVRSNCCHQIRDLCYNHNDGDCPKPRRRILPPKNMPIIEEDTDVYNGTSAQKLILSQRMSSLEVRTDSKQKTKHDPFSYYKTKKSHGLGSMRR